MVIHRYPKRNSREVSPLWAEFTIFFHFFNRKRVLKSPFEIICMQTLYLPYAGDKLYDRWEKLRNNFLCKKWTRGKKLYKTTFIPFIFPEIYLPYILFEFSKSRNIPIRIIETCWDCIPASIEKANLPPNFVLNWVSWL